MIEEIQSVLSGSLKGAVFHNGEWLIGKDCHLEIPEQRRLAKLICRLFPKTVDNLGGFESKPESRSVQRRKAAQQGGLAPDFSKPDESRLLREEEMEELYDHQHDNPDAIETMDIVLIKAQRDLTASRWRQVLRDTITMKDAECQARVERIEKELSALAEEAVEISDWGLVQQFIRRLSGKERND